MIKPFARWGLIAASMLLVVSCAKKTGFATDADDSDVSSQGLGEVSRFAGQQAGETYTTKAPHNQVYLFAFDNSTLATKYTASVNAQANYLKSHPGARILLAGHTDERGSREYNVALGERRANTVAQLMRMAGVDKHQIRVISYGKERLVNVDHDDNAHRQNRRVELIYEATR